MWNPIKIEIYNLFSHKESIYYFKNNSCTVIFGKNETDRGLENNGAGKTTLLEAICIALTNESLRTIKKESFINRDEDDCKIIFDLHNPVLKMKLKIIRQFFRGNKPVKVEIWENDVLNKQIVSVNEANKRVLELIGISREDLLRYFIISQDNHYTFFTASDSDKKEIMNRITSADMINPIIEELDLRYKENNVKYKDINDKISKLSDKRELLDEQRREVLANDNTDEELKELSDKIIEAEENVDKIDNDLKKWNKIIEEKDAQIKSITVEDTTQFKKDRKKLKEEIEEIELELSDNKKTEKKLKAELEDTIICPKCNYEFIHESELKLSVEDIKLLLKEIESEIKEQIKIYKSKDIKLKNLNEKIKEYEIAEELVVEIEEEKSDYKRKIKNKTQDRIELLEKIDKWENEKKTIKKRKKDDKLLNSLNERIDECDKDIEQLAKNLLPITEEIETIKFWQFNMGRSGFMTYLANKSIKIIEGITNSYLRKFNVDISVFINGFTVLKSGEVREKIDVFVLNDGVTAEQFMSKSGGERDRITLAGVIGIQHLINLSTNGRGLNLLLLDECFHGMDSKGQENIIKIFEKMGITILMITQNVSESFNNENTLYVIKENDVSRYIKK
jgi:DNA repair exonuclease SbcCD ATPase subunit